MNQKIDLPSIEYLREKDCEFNPIHLSEVPRTAEDVSRIYGCPLKSVLKSVVFVGDGIVVVAVVPGDRKIDISSLSEAVGASSLRIATPEEVQRHTGYPVGGVTPFGIPSDVTRVMDRSVLDLEIVNIGSGVAEIGIEIARNELKKVWDGEIADIVG